MVPGLDYWDDDDPGDDDLGIDTRYEDIGINDTRYEDNKLEDTKHEDTRGNPFILILHKHLFYNSFSKYLISCLFRRYAFLPC